MTYAISHSMGKNKIQYTYQKAIERLRTDNLLEYSGFELVYNVWKQNVEPTVEEELIFCTKFIEGFYNRPSVRTTNPMGTIPDPVIDQVLRGRIHDISEKMIADIRFAHRLSMGAENIIGSILEEFIHWSLRAYGWSVCWGDCFKAVDLCSEKGDLIQIKNKSNTENSSSNKIRTGTQIVIWRRMNANTGLFYWDDLIRITGCPQQQLSEARFEGFTRKLINDNPGALFVNENELATFLGK